MQRWEAIMDACHKRARPIVMTTIAMGAGMLPIALSWGGSDQSFRSPMAVAVIGGLITSTFLSLLVIPAVFTFVDDFAQGISGGWWRKFKARGGKQLPAPASPAASADAASGR
jgi:Cu/Ag efflux pump CusA